MLGKVTKLSDYPVKNEQMSITFHGKTYGIISKGQMRWLVDATMQEVNRESMGELPEEQAQREVKKRIEAKGFAVLEDVLSQMAPTERAQWESQYRFGGITRTRK